MRSKVGRWIRCLGTAGTAALAVVVAGTAQASTHYGIISTESSSPRTAARLSATGRDGGGITVTVFPADQGAPLQDTLALSPEFFATTDSSAVPGIRNLFVGAGGQSALVRVEYVQGGAGVVLEQYSPEERVVLGLPPLADASGPTFAVPIGDLQHGTTLLIGNPLSSQNAIVVRYGQGPEEPPIAIPPFGVVVIPVTVANTLMKVRVIDTSLPVIGQLAVDTGRTTVMTVLYPLPQF